jgi:large subunit ribosomal protein L9
MKVILLERVDGLGLIGDIVEVKRGFARNFLLPKRKALRSTAPNLEYFASKKAEIEANNLHSKTEAEKVASKMNDVSIMLVRNASESGVLFGSIRGKDICESLAIEGFTVSKSQVRMSNPIKTVGNHVVTVVLHPEVVINIGVRVSTVQEQEVDKSSVSSEEQPEKADENQAYTTS